MLDWILLFLLQQYPLQALFPQLLQLIIPLFLITI
jgi:hypothetical protein